MQTMTLCFSELITVLEVPFSPFESHLLLSRYGLVHVDILVRVIVLTLIGTISSLFLRFKLFCLYSSNILLI